MLLTRREIPVLIVNLIYVPIFTGIALTRTNYEFLLYAGVILVIAAWILWKQRRVRFDLPILWGLTIWGVLHMAGGNLRVGTGVLYSVELPPLAPAYNVLRYDQFVHMFGFGVATLICHHLLRPYLKENLERWWTLALLIVLMGSGVGAINEILEFIAVVTMPETGVGGYDITMLDLCFNLLGGILAVIWLTWQRKATRLR